MLYLIHAALKSVFACAVQVKAFRVISYMNLINGCRRQVSLYTPEMLQVQKKVAEAQTSKR